MHAHRKVLAGAFAAAVLFAACGDSDGDDATSESTQPSTSLSVDNSVEDTETIPPDGPEQIEFADIDRSGFTDWRLPALGGVEFAVPPGASVHHDGDMVFIRNEWSPDDGRYLPAAVIALVSQRAGAAGPVTKVNELVTFGIDDVGTAEPTGTMLEIDDHQLEGWDFTADADVDIGPHYLFAGMPRPIETPTAWQPFPLATLFMADTPAGALAIGFTAADDTGLATAEELFEQIAPTIALDDDREVTDVVLAVHPNPGGFATPVDVPDGWPADLEGANVPIDAGTYSTGNIGTPLHVTVGDGWWVQPNGPGWVVLTGNDSFGPGDRGLSFKLGLDTIVPISDAFAASGPTVAIEQGAGWPVDQLPTLSITNDQAVEVGGRDALQFDVTIDPEADCSTEEPCSYQLLQSSPLPAESIRKGASHRVWEITGGLDKPITIIASAADPAWLDQATEVVETISFEAP